MFHVSAGCLLPVLARRRDSREITLATVNKLTRVLESGWTLSFRQRQSPATSTALGVTRPPDCAGVSFVHATLGYGRWWNGVAPLCCLFSRFQMLFRGVARGYQLLHPSCYRGWLAGHRAKASSPPSVLLFIIIFLFRSARHYSLFLVSSSPAKLLAPTREKRTKTVLTLDSYTLSGISVCFSFPSAWRAAVLFITQQAKYCFILFLRYLVTCHVDCVSRQQCGKSSTVCVTWTMYVNYVSRRLNVTSTLYVNYVWRRLCVTWTMYVHCVWRRLCVMFTMCVTWSDVPPQLFISLLSYPGVKSSIHILLWQRVAMSPVQKHWYIFTCHVKYSCHILHPPCIGLIHDISNSA